MVLRGAWHNTWNAWREKTVHHFDRDQEGKKGNQNFSGKLPKTATSLRGSFMGDSTSPSEGASSTRTLRRSRGNVTTGTDSGGSSGGGGESTRTIDSTS